jgi:dolichol-phosphate mannosyltransferase
MVYSSKIKLSLIIPTYNERGNIEGILKRATRALEGTVYEIIVVDDDSDDHTWELVQELSCAMPTIRLERRQGRKRDLAQSIKKGFILAAGDILGCMDADGSHPPEAISELLATCEGGAEMAVGSRYVAGGSISGWPFSRRRLSRAATVMTRWLLRIPVRDPLSGFFLMRRTIYDRVIDTKPRGFKILLDFYVRGRPASVAEVPIHFNNRRCGSSKLSAKILYHGVAGVLSLMRFEATAKASEFNTRN